MQESGIGSITLFLVNSDKKYFEMILFRIVLLFNLFVLPINLLAQKSQAQLEAELERHFEKIDYWNSHHEISDSIVGQDTIPVIVSDSIVYENEHISNILLEYLKEATIKKFVKLSDIVISSSPDKKLLIYSWNNNLGGTAIINSAIMQINISGQYYDSLLVADESFFIDTIYQVTSKGNTYYMLVGSGKYSTFALGQDVRIYSIDKDRLKEEEIIKTRAGLTNSIHINYDLSGMNNKEIKFDRKKNELFIPIALPNGKMTSRYIIYRFNGSYFVKT